MVNSSPAAAGDTGGVGLVPGSGRPLEKEMASVLAWKIPWTKKPGGLQRRGSRSQA